MNHILCLILLITPSTKIESNAVSTDSSKQESKDTKESKATSDSKESKELRENPTNYTNNNHTNLQEEAKKAVDTAVMLATNAKQLASKAMIIVNKSEESLKTMDDDIRTRESIKKSLEVSKSSAKQAIRAADNATILSEEASQAIRNSNETISPATYRRTIEKASDATKAAKRSLRETKLSAKLSQGILEDMLHSMKESSHRMTVETIKKQDDPITDVMAHTQTLIGDAQRMISRTVEYNMEILSSVSGMFGRQDSGDGEG